MLLLSSVYNQSVWLLSEGRKEAFPAVTFCFTSKRLYLNLETAITSVLLLIQMH